MATQALLLEVLMKEPIAKDVVRLRLGRPDRERLPDWAPGAHVGINLPSGERCYSLCGDRWDAHTYEVAVLREHDGRGGSAHLHDVVHVGSQLLTTYPRNNFPMVPAQNYVFVAGGIGITPLLPMIAQAQLVGAEWRLVYGGRSRDSMAFLQRLEGHADRVLAVAQDKSGHPDLEAALGGLREDTVVYCCGPEGLVAAVGALMSGREDRLRTERFVNTSTGDGRAHAFAAVLAGDGRRLEVPAERSLLDVLVEAGVEVVGSCREGVCGTCVTTVVTGEVDHRDVVLTDDERRRLGAMLPCVSRSRTPELVLDL